MNKLTREDRARILHLLCEGNSIRAVTRLTGSSKKAVSRLLVDAGQAASWYQDRVFRNLNCKRVQVDELWSFVHCKQKNVAGAKKAPHHAGDCWTWTAIDADTKLIPSWYVGSRDSDAPIIFMDDLASRLSNRVQLTSDGHKAYLEGVESAFGGDVDYAMLIKRYVATSESAKGRYSPAECIGARKMRVEGDPDIDHVSTSYAERSNLSVRMHTAALPG
jgi:IS1 family transposase